MLRTTSEELKRQIEVAKAKRLDELKQSFHYEKENGFWNFCKYLYPDFFKDDQTERIRYAEILRKSGAYSITGKAEYAMYRKVMINIFPRFGKSFMLSIFCVWLLYFYPKGSIMRNSHDARLAEKFSRDVRNIIEETNKNDEERLGNNTLNKKMRAIAPKMRLSADKRSLDMWALNSAKDISYFCAGVKGGITGTGCDLAMILDDPVKDPEKALSATFNNELYDWYLTTHRSRRDRNSEVVGCEIIVMARWSTSDLCSLLLKAETDWHVVSFDAEDAEGNSACESIFKTEELKRMRKGFINSGRIAWWKALYRQKVDGIGKKLFPAEKLQRFSPAECGLDFSDERRFQRIGYCDVADEGTDSLSAPMGYFDIGTGDVYITDILFTKEPSNVSKVLLAEKIVENKIQIMVFESNNGGKMYGELVQAQIERLTGGKDIDYTPEYKHTSSNKITKILVYADVVLSKVHFLDGAIIEEGSDYAMFLRELTDHEKERKNEHDDAPDSICSLAKRFCMNGAVQIG